MTHREEKDGAPRNNVSRLLLVLILAISALVQFTVVSRTTVDIPLRADARDYFSYAHNLREHGVYSRMDTWAEGAGSQVPIPDNIRSPGYPLFLAMLGAPKPDDSYLRRASLVQAGLGVLSVWLLYLVAAGFLGRRWALVPALLVALSPHLATISTYLLTESLFFFLLLASLLATQKALASERKRTFLLAGTLWGLCSLVRPTVQFLPPLFLAAVLVVPAWRRFRSKALLAIAGFALVFGPWVIRNQSESVTRTPSTLMVKTLLHGSYPDFMFQGKPETLGFPYRADPDSEAKSKDLPTVLAHIADRFRAEPAQYLMWYLVGKPIYFLSWGEIQGFDILIYPVSHTPYYEDVRFAAVRMFSLLLHWPLVILGLLTCLVLSLRRRWLVLGEAGVVAALVVAVVVFYAIALHMLAAPFPRYGVPFRPLMFALAILPIRAVFLRWKTRRTSAAI